jgi:protein-glutamine gamma-glutamyltransferase
VIFVSGMNSIDPSLFSGMERTIFMRKDQSPIVYRYESLTQLRFELNLRIKILEAANGLLKSKAAFASFKKSRCNSIFWNLTAYGGFALKRGELPSTAIRDIFTNGTLYAFECSTAIVIVLYKAVLDSIGDKRFNQYFADLLLWSWILDKDLRYITINSNRENYPGDILYFNNPDFIPDKPEWRGENVVKLDENLYYGHGIGITNAEDIISVLNKIRKPNSTRSAYVLEQASYPDFKYLFHIAAGSSSDHYDYESVKQFNRNLITAKIGFSRQIRVFDINDEPYPG